MKLVVDFVCLLRFSVGLIIYCVACLSTREGSLKQNTMAFFSSPTLHTILAVYTRLVNFFPFVPGTGIGRDGMGWFFHDDWVEDDTVRGLGFRRGCVFSSLALVYWVGLWDHETTGNRS